MTAQSVRSRLSAHDKALIGGEVARLDGLACRLGRKPALQGELIDCAARLRTVLIWAG